MFRFQVGSLALSAALSVVILSPDTGHAATVATIHVFQGGSDGGFPAGDVLLGPDGSIYGKSYGNTEALVVFRLSPQTGINTSLFSGSVGADDANSGVAFGGNGAIYGASYFNAGFGQCGASCGVVWQLDGATGSLSTIYQFKNNGDGRGTQGVITGPAGALYGVTDEGGANNQGYIFRLDPANGGLTTLHSFTATVDGSSGGYGVGVQFGPDGALYGVTGSGGQYGYGTMYRFDPASRAFKALHQFTATDGHTYIFNTPPSLVISDTGGTIYGTTLTGGTYGKGMIYRLVLETGDFRVLHSFNGADGLNPTRLVLGTAGDLWGVTVYGGTGNFGTVFKFNMLSGLFTSVYNFTNLSDGAYPGQGGLIFGADGTLYGTTGSGGGSNGSGSGTVFKVTP